MEIVAPITGNKNNRYTSTSWYDILRTEFKIVVMRLYIAGEPTECMWIFWTSIKPTVL